MNAENRARAEAARAALDAYNDAKGGGYVDDAECATDLLADLGHLGLNLPAIAASAGLHVGAELPDPPAELADAWARFTGAKDGAVTAAELRDLDEWRASVAEDYGLI